MTKLRLERDLPYPPAQLWEMVGDVERYPEFIPWIKSLRAYNRAVDQDIVRFDADVSVGFKMLTERFSTRVTRAAEAFLVDFDLIKGPFRRLQGRWTFTPIATGTKVAFDMDIDIKNPILDAIFKANFNLAVSKLLAIFEARAKQLYGRTALK
ncbi:type II toxin-antitoxin system RatA family toxin [Asticcacaulis sp.]|uniref:type II toxin-antitoxin system RatA family toxin n=1 Tax=Asticcacaulis sp. TaxID=1872648 RepID=UPI002CD001D2|nr:SRPBCC family protein [Asticcacaulis sp.]HTM82385.1 SRPBCC family protein [Asticcacaulis sp.]